MGRGPPWLPGSQASHGGNECPKSSGLANGPAKAPGGTWERASSQPAAAPGGAAIRRASPGRPAYLANGDGAPCTCTPTGIASGCSDALERIEIVPCCGPRGREVVSTCAVTSTGPPAKDLGSRLSQGCSAWSVPKR